MTPNQRKGFDVIRQGNAIPVGKNALEANLPVGDVLGPTQVWIVHQTWPVTP